MSYYQKLNRQLFLFIAGFVVFAYLIAVFFKVPLDNMVFGAPLNEWEYINELNVFGDEWQEVNGNLPVSVQEAVQLFAVIEGFEENVSAYRELLKETTQIPADSNEILLREDLYRLASRILDTDKEGEVMQDYFLGEQQNGLPLDLLAHLGIVQIPYNRIFEPFEIVTRAELAQVVARAIWPAMRSPNAPVIVFGRQKYTYTQMKNDLQLLANAYPELITLLEIGRSVEGRSIYAARLGHGTTEIFVDGSIHASEWLTTSLIMKVLEEYAHHARHQQLLGGYDIAAMLQNDVSFWFIPMVNPDGVTLVLEGSQAVEHESFVQQLLQQEDESRLKWKANIRGIDLNRQFPTAWQRLVNVKKRPSPSHFKGYEPLSEPEAAALYQFTLEREPSMVISYHQQGEVLFWYNRQTGPQRTRDQRIVQGLSALTGYPVDRQHLVNGGKYMDWVIDELGVPAVIVEIGTRVGDLQEWDRIWVQNRYLGLGAAELVLQENLKEH